MLTLDLIGEITAKSCAPLAARIEAAEDDLILRIDSPGGEVEAGVRLAVALARWAESHPANSLTLEVGAMACSMAANLLALAPERARVVGYAASSLMFHSVRGIAEGTPQDIIASARYMGGINAQVVAGLAKRTGRPEEEFRPWFRGSEHWLTGREALDVGIFSGLASGAAALKTESLVALYKLAAQAASSTQQTEEEKNMADELKKPCAEDAPGIVEEIKEEVKEEVKEAAPAPEEEIKEEVVEEVAEDSPAEGEPIEDIVAALRAKVAELEEEITALKAAKASLTGGLRLRKDAPAAVPEDWLALVKALPACAPREYAERYKALKAAHAAAYKAYMSAHSVVRKIR